MHHASLLRAHCSNPDVAVAVSLSPQACASIALATNSSVDRTAARLSSFLRSLGADFVFSTSVGAHIAVEEACTEFEARYLANLVKPNPGRLGPLLCSECPGFTVYVEKTLPQRVVRLLSKVRSPQAIMSAALKRIGELPHPPPPLPIPQDSVSR